MEVGLSNSSSKFNHSKLNIKGVLMDKYQLQDRLILILKLVPKV